MESWKVEEALRDDLLMCIIGCILMQMRTTLNLDEKLLTRAARLSGIDEKTALLHAGLEALIARESARRLATLGGTERKLGSIPRRRSPAKS
jgi:Arc/MetJ family transcription regulator